MSTRHQRPMEDGIVRGEVLFGIDDLLPLDAFAGVGGHAAHEAEENAVAHPVAVINGRAAAEAIGHQDVLAILVNRELRRNDFLRVSMRNDFVAGVRDRLYGLRNAFGE